MSKGLNEKISVKKYSSNYMLTHHAHPLIVHSSREKLSKIFTSKMHTFQCGNWEEQIRPNSICRPTFGEHSSDIPPKSAIKGNTQFWVRWWIETESAVQSVS